MNEYLKNGLVSLVIVAAVVGGVEWFRAPVDVDAIALEAAGLVDVPAAIKGEKGDRGPAGLKGDKGDKGDAGVQGAVGPQGPKGEAGPVSGLPATWTEITLTGGNLTFNVPATGSYKFTFETTGTAVNPKLYKGSDVVKSFGVISPFSTSSFEFVLGTGDYKFNSTVTNPVVEVFKKVLNTNL